MQTDQRPKKKKIVTDRPAPLLPGFYSLQALSEGGLLPSITQYHRKPEPAVAWKNTMAKKRFYDAFALCSSDSRWDLFDNRGKAIGSSSTISPDEGIFMEVTSPVVVDAAEYVESVKTVLGDTVCCMTFAEHHSHASSVGHSNMVVVARQLIMDASEEDAKHLYLADSVDSGCRVQGWFMDSAKISSKFMDRYLDRYKWLSNGWPLANDHHMQVLAYRMATMRTMQLMEIVLTVSDMVNLGEHKSLVAMRIQHAKPEILIMFAAKMLEGMESAILIKSPQALEAIDIDVLAEHSVRIAALYRETFL